MNKTEESVQRIELILNKMLEKSETIALMLSDLAMSLKPREDRPTVEFRRFRCKDEHCSVAATVRGEYCVNCVSLGRDK